MRLLRLEDDGRFSLVECVGKSTPPYAILSHTWGADHEEVNFKDLVEGTGKSKTGYTKIRFCGAQAAKDDLQYFWVDSCCIDKSNNTELSEALNSMFRWYQEAEKCYVYLSDVAMLPSNAQIPSSPAPWKAAFRSSRWFTRGWTLQELIAPASVEFFSVDWNFVGNKGTLQHEIHEITGIPIDALQGRDLSHLTVSERMSWAANRQTRREEDRAYSLMGIFNVYMSPIYGEGLEHALTRLHEEISRRSRASLDRLPHVPQAVYNSYDNRDEPTCLPDTRVQVLQEIRDWYCTDTGPPIFWLSGLAGMGKTTIARTVAQEADEKGSLGASFFFTRRATDLASPKKFFPSIAIQCAKRIPALETFIRESLEKHPDLPQLRLLDQWRQLVHAPFCRLPHGSHLPRLLLVIDALDECEGENDVRELLRLLLEAKDIPTVRFRVFVTSRPETPIRLGFRQMPSFVHRDLSLQSLPREAVDRDIRTFLIHEFAEIRQQLEIFRPNWPGHEVIDTLVQESSGLFIYAATVCRFIKSNDQWGTEDLLRMILPSEHTLRLQQRKGRLPRRSPFSDLDKIYNQVLEHSLQQMSNLEDQEDIAEEMGEIVSTIALVYEPLSIDALASLLDQDEITVYQRLKHLRSVLVVPDDTTSALRLLHPSFRDFLFDPKRCTSRHFSIDQTLAHKRMFGRCLDVLSNNLRQDICALDSPGTRATDIGESRLTDVLPLHVQYACVYWARHLLNVTNELRDDSQVFDFLRNHSLHWLEALSWLRKLSDGIHVLGPLRSLMLLTTCSSLVDFIYDLERFALHSRQAIEQAPLQVYASALIFAPQRSPVRQQFQGDTPQWVHQLSSAEETWSSTLQTLEAHAGTVNDVTFSPDGTVIASASDDRTIRLWDVRSGRQQQTLTGHSASIRAIRFSPDGNTIASASDDQTIGLWDVLSGRERQVLWGHSSSVRAVAFSPDGTILATASNDHTLKLWDAQSGSELQTLKGHSSIIYGIAFSQDGSTIASASWDHTIKLWNMRSRREQQTFHGHMSGVRSVAFSPDNIVIVSASYDGTIKLWEADSSTKQHTLMGHSSGVRAVAFSPDGNVIASGSYDNTVKLWDARSGLEKQTLNGHLDYVNAVAFSPDGTIVASASDDRTVKLWDVRAGPDRQILQGHPGSIHAVVFSPDGTVIASASSDYTVKLWDACSGRVIQTLTGHSGGVRAVAFSPDGTVIATASHDATIKLWGVQSGHEQQTLEAHLDAVNDIAFSPDGNLIASASSDCTVKLWDVRSGQEHSTLGIYPGWVTAVAFSPDNAVIAAASADRVIRLWDVRSNLERQTFSVDGITNDISFSRDGSFLCTEWGFIDIISGNTSLTLPSATPSISVQTEWIVRDSNRLLWLPSEFRARHVAVFRDKVALGHTSGQVTILEFM